jgi:two-component system, chemotaxis family, chemotaxis protein CheY
MKNTSPRILIVEDDADIRDLMKIVLEADGYSVDVAADGIEAFNHLNAGTKPALILLDMMMPRMDGEQFMKEVRSTRFSKIPVVIVSGHCLGPKRARDLEAASCLIKPVEFSELLKTVRRFAPAA